MLENLRTNKDILDFLMTSEFLEDELKPSELRDLLLKFRWFYRSSHSKQQSMNIKIDNLEKKVDYLERDNDNLYKLINEKDNKFKNVVDRKLSFKERIFGEIYENKSKRKIRIFKK